MARIRTVKPEMAQDEDLASCSIEAQLLAIRLLNFADDEGYFKAHPALIKASCFPLIDSLNVPVMLRELSEVGYLRLETGSDGKDYGQIVNFLKHQSINKPYPSKIKDLIAVPECSGSDTGALPSGMEWNGKGMEQGKGMELIAPSDESLDAAIKIPLVDKSDFPITAKQIQDWQTDFPGIDVAQELRNCRQWNIANPKNRKTKSGVMKHITSWLTKAQNRARPMNQPLSRAEAQARYKDEQFAEWEQRYGTQ